MPRAARRFPAWSILVTYLYRLILDEKFRSPQLWASATLVVPGYEKPRQHPKILTGFFMLSPLSRLLHLNKQCRLDWFVPRPAEKIQQAR
jgi:hypothetical protein